MDHSSVRAEDSAAEIYTDVDSGFRIKDRRSEWRALRQLDHGTVNVEND